MASFVRASLLQTPMRITERLDVNARVAQRCGDTRDDGRSALRRGCGTLETEEENRSRRTADEGGLGA